ncbi:MAG: ABC transporter ATP-binding protein/permease [Bacteroidetes bacterium]|nr:ABC transporter ATP-binding protein/permease [Bacteroidota bacterium]
MKKILKLVSYLKPYKKEIILNIFLNILGVFFGLFSITMAIPFLGVLFETEQTVQTVGDFEFTARSIEQHFYYYLHEIINTYQGKEAGLLFICVMVIILFFIKNLFVYFANYYMAPIRNGIVRDIRNKVFRKVLQLPLSYYSDTKKGDIIARMSSDVQEVEFSIMSSMEMFFRNPITIIVFLATLFFMNVKLTLFVIILLPASGYIIGRIGKSLKRTSRVGQKKMGLLLSVIEETLSGLRIIKAFNAEDKIESRFVNLNNLLTRIMNKMFRRRMLAPPLSEYLGTLVLVVVMWYGGSLVLDQLDVPEIERTMTSQGFIGYLLIFSQIIGPAKSFSTSYFNIQKGLASVERINELLNTENTIKEIQNPVPIKEFKDSIEYRNVSFRYEQEWVLRNINLKISKGKTIAIVGQSGAGKTTLADMLPRFFEATEGDILIDGIPIRNAKLRDVRDLMGIVTQESILFNDTFFNNIAFGMPSATIEEVEKAAKVANSHEFIIASPNDYHFNIGDKGNKMSGGQRQRICIARAVLKNPPILILDEATSSLDTESERLVQDALFKLMKNRTSLVIAHRLSTIQHADEIIVLDNGEIAERGTHEDLLKVDGIYRKLHDMQMFDS